MVAGRWTTVDLRLYPARPSQSFEGYCVTKVDLGDEEISEW